MMAYYTSTMELFRDFAPNPLIYCFTIPPDDENSKSHLSRFVPHHVTQAADSLHDEKTIYNSLPSRRSPSAEGTLILVLMV